MVCISRIPFEPENKQYHLCGKYVTDWFIIKNWDDITASMWLQDMWHTEWSTKMKAKNEGKEGQVKPRY